jgi:hypothetical protein
MQRGQPASPPLLEPKPAPESTPLLEPELEPPELEVPPELEAPLELELVLPLLEPVPASELPELGPVPELLEEPDEVEPVPPCEPLLEPVELAPPAVPELFDALSLPTQPAASEVPSKIAVRQVLDTTLHMEQPFRSLSGTLPQTTNSTLSSLGLSTTLVGAGRQ